MNSLYTKFGYEIVLLERKHGTEIFELLQETRIPRRGRTASQYANDRNVLKGEIKFALMEPRYNSVGIFKDEKLVGISFNSITEDDHAPWLGYFFIEAGSRKTKASIVLINYITNHLYKGVRVQIGNTNTFEYRKLVRELPAPINFSVFNNGVVERFAKLCGENIETDENACYTGSGVQEKGLEA